MFRSRSLLLIVFPLGFALWLYSSKSCQRPHQNNAARSSRAPSANGREEETLHRRGTRSRNGVCRNVGSSPVLLCHYDWARNGGAGKSLAMAGRSYEGITKVERGPYRYKEQWIPCEDWPGTKNSCQSKGAHHRCTCDPKDPQDALEYWYWTPEGQAWLKTRDGSLFREAHPVHGMDEPSQRKKDIKESMRMATVTPEALKGQPVREAESPRPARPKRMHQDKLANQFTFKAVDGGLHITRHPQDPNADKLPEQDAPKPKVHEFQLGSKRRLPRPESPLPRDPDKPSVPFKNIKSAAGISHATEKNKSQGRERLEGSGKGAPHRDAGQSSHPLQGGPLGRPHPRDQYLAELEQNQKEKTSRMLRFMHLSGAAYPPRGGSIHEPPWHPAGSPPHSAQKQQLWPPLLQLGTPKPGQSAFPEKQQTVPNPSRIFDADRPESRSSSLSSAAELESDPALLRAETRYHEALDHYAGLGPNASAQQEDRAHEAFQRADREVKRLKSLKRGEEPRAK